MDVQREKDPLADAVQGMFSDFLEQFSSDPPGTDNPQRDYIQMLATMENTTQSTVYVDFQHVSVFNDVLAGTIEDSFYRYEPALRRALGNIIAKYYPNMLKNKSSRPADRWTAFWVGFRNVAAFNKVRDLKTDKIGQLLSVSGTVTRTSEVRPELISATFTCFDCHSKIKRVEQQFKYTEPTACTNTQCMGKTFVMDMDDSQFVDWQRIRVQENSSEIPSGSMPRSLDVILRHDAVEQAKAGDKCIFTGTLIVVPDVSQMRGVGESAQAVKSSTRGAASQTRGLQSDGVTGLKQLGVRDLSYRLAFLATSVEMANTLSGVSNIREDNPDVVLSTFTKEQIAEIKQIKETPRLYDAMIESIAPHVFGHEEIKRGVLLMLFGGVQKRTPEGIKLRGDINVCIIGDPSTSKSQFLKYVVSFLPRAVYTSGKSASAAGLTASVVKDPESGQFGIEAGALMLADNGICCIDEFDKMDVKDQVAIHEAMEQQTISIAKAGIQATLNARASILAAANPVGGRYDKSKSLRANVALSAAIMSRFDLFFVVVDEVNPTADYHIARHIVDVHKQVEQAINVRFNTGQLQRYIRFARTLKPVMTDEAADLLASFYRKLRQSDVSGASRTAYRITVRQLESMIRLSEALARLHCDNKVRPAYVREAARLLKKSIIHVQSEDVNLDEALEEDGDNMDIDDGPPGGPGDGGDGGDPRNGAPPADSSHGPTPAAKKRSITFEEYARVSKIMVIKVLRRAHEDKQMTQNELVNWYLEQIATELEGEEDLIDQFELYNKVVNRLITKERLLIVVGVGEDDADEHGHPIPPERLRLLDVNPEQANEFLAEFQV